MGFVNLSEKTISAKLVYYGVGLGGKTTSLKVVHGLMCPRDEVKLVSINTEQDATLLFDFLPIDLGLIDGFKIRIQGFTVPGQDKYVTMRRYVLQGADAVVLVVDSQRSRIEENLRSIEDLKRNLAANGLDFDKLPLVFQYNKRDLDDLVPEDELDRLCNPRGAPSFSTIATEGVGVLDAFLESVGLMVDQKVRQYGLGRGEIDPAELAEEAKTRIRSITDELADEARRAGREETENAGGLVHLTVSDEVGQETLADYEAKLEGPELGEELLPAGEAAADLIATDDDLDAIEYLEDRVDEGAASPDLDLFDEELDFDSEGMLDADELELVEDEDLALAPAAGRGEEETADSAALEAIGETNELLGQAINSNIEMAGLYAELAEYKQLLEKKNRELVEVIQLITHDLKRPLTVFKTVVGLLGKGHLGPLNERQGEAVHNATESVSYMEDLLLDILEASRLDYDGVQLEFAEVDMTQLVGDILRKLKYQIDESQVRVRVEPLPCIRADGDALTKVLMNLIGNAVSYHNPKAQQPWIRVEHQETEEEWVFEVSDNGLGIPEESLSSIWQKFERGANTREITGTGLGLYIVKQIVLGHGGEIQVQSKVGEGTCFTIRLPKVPVLAKHSPLA
ncbi:MAG: hypothetical protein CSA62_14850 [Planctomycetota bacterium]|nr:MAG: hypothetical protein CSA62_14850 [Planctomycetota bacterium]